MHTIVTVLLDWRISLLWGYMRWSKWLRFYLLHSKFGSIFPWSIIRLIWWEIICKLWLISWSHWRVYGHCIAISIWSLFLKSWVLVIIILLLKWRIVLLSFICIVSIFCSILVVSNSTCRLLFIVLRIFQTLKLLELLWIITALLFTFS